MEAVGALPGRYGSGQVAVFSSKYVRSGRKFTIEVHFGLFMPDCHLLLEGLPCAHCTPAKGGLEIKTVID
jgi:hypothetical protein